MLDLVEVPTRRPLTVKLRGRTEAPDWSRGRTISSRARGDATEPHGTLQRLLGVRINVGGMNMHYQPSVTQAV